MLLNIIFKFIFSVLFISIWLPSFCYAEDASLSTNENADGGRDLNDCLIAVRSIKGIDHREDRSDTEHSIDKSFNDIQDQLEDLPFAHFEQIDLIEKKTDFEREVNFTPHCAMGNLHKLDITPHQLSDEKVDVTISWNAPTGEMMMSSRMKFPNGQSVVLGTENPKQTCTIMVVKVACRKQ